jgi:hypothetical protein
MVRGEAATRYRAVAERILATLASPAYLGADSSEAALAHSVGSFPGGQEIDVGLIYADYYFVEALLRLRELQGRTARLRLLSDAPPPVHSLRGVLLRAARERLRDGDRLLLPALQRLRAQADSALTAGPFTVTVKKRLPPSGDPRDYVSYGPYWWPDSTKPDGLPYVRRDGVVNQVLRRESDAPRLYAMTDAVETLALAWFFTDDVRYAERAALLLRTWFLDPATRMNPHLRFGQAIPGVTEGRGIGIIDTRDMGRITDALTLLRGAPAWTPADRATMDSWLATFLNWLRSSSNGLDEQDEPNNHGTWYDAQTAAIAMFLGDTATARVISAGIPDRIAQHVDSAGRLPLELARNRSLHYSVFDLEAFARLADLASHTGADLWQWQGPGGASIRSAIDFLAPYADPANQWPFEQVTTEPDDLLVPLLFRANAALPGDKYLQAIGRMPASITRAHRARLLFPLTREPGAPSADAPPRG